MDSVSPQAVSDSPEKLNPHRFFGSVRAAVVVLIMAMVPSAITLVNAATMEVERQAQERSDLLVHLHYPPSGVAERGVVQKWTFLERREGRRANFSGARLDKSDLRLMDLHDIDAVGTHIREVNLEGADLRGANLRGAVLNSSNLAGADLRGADLRGAFLFRVRLDGAQLEGADLRGAHTDDASSWPVCPESQGAFVLRIE